MKCKKVLSWTITKSERRPFVYCWTVAASEASLEWQQGHPDSHKDRLHRIDTVFGIISGSIRFNHVNLTEPSILNDSNTTIVLMQNFLKEKYFQYMSQKNNPH